MNLWREPLVTVRGLTQSGNVLVLMVLVSLGNEAVAQYSGGMGIPEDPYIIASAQDLIDRVFPASLQNPKNVFCGAW